MTVRVLHGNCRDVLCSLPSQSVQMCVTSPPYYGLRSYLPDGHPDKALEIGQERTPDEYVARLVEVFGEVRRVLRDDGTLWVNIGDSYAANRSYQISDSKHKAHSFGSANAIRIPAGYKPKDLLGIPWLLAFALRADGWYLRNDIVWAKRNCMPESVRDRCTRAHEYIFHFSKSADYFYDAVAIEEDGETPAGTRAAKGSNVRSEIKDVNGRPPEYYEYTGKRNKRSVWWMTTQPFAEAHFATFPPELPEICIKAGTSEEGACPQCGAAWERVLGDPVPTGGRSAGNGFKRDHRISVGGRGDETVWEPKVRATIGWQPTCACPEHKPVPCVVLDPFGGAGTTGLVADRLGRDAILIDLHPDYCAMARRRIEGDAPLFAEVTA